MLIYSPLQREIAQCWFRQQAPTMLCDSFGCLAKAPWKERELSKKKKKQELEESEVEEKEPKEKKKSQEKEKPEEKLGIRSAFGLGPKKVESVDVLSSSSSSFLEEVRHYTREAPSHPRPKPDKNFPKSEALKNVANKHP